MKSHAGLLTFCTIAFLLTSGCEKDENSSPYIFTDENIASFDLASETVLRQIPVQYINAARNNLHVAYQHTSHGTHVSYGLYGLQDYKTGDDVLFGITNNDPQPDKLDFRDYAMAAYAEAGVDAADLSRVESAFIQATRNYLDDQDNAEINVVIWSWCSISGHDVAGTYLPGMQALIDEYGPGGSKIGTGAGKRENAVTFIFMTGHAEANNNVGNLKPRNQADTIIGYCKAKGFFCLDYYGIDAHSMDGRYWEDAGDDGNSAAYGGNFYIDFQNDNQLGTHYYENKSSPGGSVTYGAHNSQHITANRKAYAMWYILARIAGWDGK